MTLVTDNFNRADENLSASADWTLTVGTATDAQVVTNEVEFANAVTYHVVETAVSNEDMYAQAQVTGLSTDTQCGPQVRMDPATADGDGYMMMRDGFASEIARLRRTDGDSRTTLASTSASVSDNDTLYVEASGSAIEGQIVGVETITATDATYGGASTDHPGVYGFSSPGNTIDNFEADVLSGGITQAVGQVTETDIAQPVSSAKAKTLGLATEADAAQAVTSAKTKTLGLATETDAAQPVTTAKARTIGQPTETDAALALTAAKVKTIGLATETDLAQPVTAGDATPVGQAVETDQALAITVLKTVTLGQAVETDLAQPITTAGIESIVTAKGTHSLVATATGTYAATVAATGTHDLIVEAEGAL